MTIAELIRGLEVIAYRSPDGMDMPVRIDVGDERIAAVKVEVRAGDEGPWIALVPGKTEWSPDA